MPNLRPSPISAPILLAITLLVSGCAAAVSTDREGAGAATAASPPPAQTRAAAGADDAPPPPDGSAEPAPPMDDVDAPGAPAAGALLRRAFRLQELQSEAERALEDGRTEAALAALDEALAIDPSEPQASALKARALREAGRLDDALATVRAARAEHPRDYYLVREEALGLEAKGDLPGAVEVLDSAAVHRGYRPRLHRLRARLHALLGKSDAALEDLRRAVTTGFIERGELLSDPSFQAFRDDPRFLELLQLAETRRKTIEALDEHAIAASPEHRRSRSPEDLIRELRFRIDRRDSHYLDLEATTLRGSNFRTRDLAPRCMVILAWAHWSVVSHDMLPRIIRLEERYGERGLEVLLVAVDVYDMNENFEAETRKMVEAEDIELPCVVLDARDAIRHLNAYEVPTTYFVGTEGRRYLRADGPVDQKTLETLVEILLDAHPETSPGGGDS